MSRRSRIVDPPTYPLPSPESQVPAAAVRATAGWAVPFTSLYPCVSGSLELKSDRGHNVEREERGDGFRWPPKAVGEALRGMRFAVQWYVAAGIQDTGRGVGGILRTPAVIFSISFGLVLLSGSAAAGIQEQESGKSPEISRWLEAQSGGLSFRYRHVENTLGRPDLDHAQYKVSVKARLKFDAEGRVSLNGLLTTGSGITSGFNDAGWGSPGRRNVQLTQLYLALQPAGGVTLQYGGITANRGRATEITTFDNDNYQMGGRLTLTRPRDLFFDEISATVSFMGDNRTPNITKRFHRLTQSNYRQFLVVKKINDRISASADYESLNGRDTLRQAITARVAETRVLDSVVFEHYQRLDPETEYGFALHGEKAVHRRVRIGGGYADIDRLYGGLNADRFDRGSRLFGSVNLSLPANFSFETFVARAVATDYPISNRLRIDLAISYNALPALKRLGL